MKYLGVNMTKYVKYEYTKKDKTLLRNIKEDVNKWEIHFVHVELEDAIIKISVLPWLIYRFRILVSNLQKSWKQTMFSNYNRIKIAINNRKTLGKSRNFWKLNSTI